MTSARNLRQRLSGSKYVIGLLLLLLLNACSTTKKTSSPPNTTSRPPAQVPEQHIPVPTEPKTDTIRQIPAVKTDTVAQSPKKETPVKDTDVSPKKTIKAIPEITLLLPLDGLHADFTAAPDPKRSRFIQFYAGASMAMQYLDSIGLRVNLQSYDTKVSGDFLSNLTGQHQLKTSDVILGPYDKEDIELVAAYGQSNKTMVISPWMPAYSPEKENPYFIQMNPGLGTHAQAIIKYIEDTWPLDKVYIVSRDNPVELNRIQLFKKSATIEIEDLIIKDGTPDLINTDLHQLMSESGKTIFILPYYLKTDETFVNSFLRKLHADKDTREVIIFGLPQWLGFSNLNPNYLESLSAHLSMSSFIDVNHPRYAAFRNRFFQTYHYVPDLNAYQGYDLVIWMANQLKTAGPEGLIGAVNPGLEGMAMGFDMVPVYKSGSDIPEANQQPLYYENRQIRIVRFSQQDYHIVK